MLEASSSSGKEKMVLPEHKADFITFDIADFYSPPRSYSAKGGYHKKYSEGEMRIIRTIFGRNAKIVVEVKPIALNAGYGSFRLSHEAEKDLGLSPEDEEEEGFKNKQNSIEFRSSDALIATINKLGFKGSSDGGKLYFAGIPAQYPELVTIAEYDGGESIEFDSIGAIRNLATKTLSLDEMRSMLTEIAFISIVFRKINDHFRK